MSALLEIKGLYGGYEKGVNILQSIDLTVEQGEAVGIIGLNGSGKSTLGKAVMNLLPYRRGKILFDGQHIEDKTTHELAQMGMSMMHQGGPVFPNLSVWENLQLAARKSQFSIIYSHLSEVVPLLQQPAKELQRLMADKLSGGQRHQFSLAMILATKPRLVILDEPSAGLSPKAVEDMYIMLNSIKEKLNVTIILIEQNIAKAVDFCERCFLQEQGELVEDFKKKNIMDVEKILFNLKT